jgi:uncharacterized caspase-like protein
MGIGYVNSVTFSPDGGQVLSRYNNYNIKLWDINTLKVISTFVGWGEIFSPDGKQVLFCDEIDDEIYIIKLCDANTGKELRTFSGHTDRVNSVAFSPDGKQVLSGSDDKTIKLWDANSAKEIRTFSGHTDVVFSVAFSPDGRQVLSGSGDKTIKLWDASTGQEIRTFSGHTACVTPVAFSPNGKQILSGSDDGTVRLWDVASGKEIARFISFYDDEWIAITPDGYYNTSLNGDKYLNVRKGNEVYGIDKWRKTFYRPEIVEARLQGRPDPVPVTQTIQDAAPPPRITILSPKYGTHFDTPKAELSLVVEDQKQPIREIIISVGNSLIDTIEPPGDQYRWEVNLTLSLASGPNVITVTAINASETYQDTTVRVSTPTGSKSLPDLWILAVGINKYENKYKVPELRDLNYAVNDAQEIVNFFKSQEGKAYNKVTSTLISDESDEEENKPTAANIINSLYSLKEKAKDGDFILLFLAGHGKRNSFDEFFFCASDTEIDSNGKIIPATAVQGSLITSIQKAKGTKLIFIDSCHSESVSSSRGVDESINTALLMEIRVPTTTVFAACTSNESAYEYDEKQHGYFTYAVLEGLGGEAYPDPSGNITINSLELYVKNKVKELTNLKQNPVSNVEGGSNKDFIISVMK